MANILSVLLSGHLPDISGILAIGEAIAIIIGLAVTLIPIINFIMTLEYALLAMAPHNRMMSPDKVWLLFIPFFNILWLFVVVYFIAESYRGEFLERNIKNTEARPSFGIGLATAILLVGCFIPKVNFYIVPVFLVCWIIYWVRVARLKDQLEYAKSANSH